MFIAFANRCRQIDVQGFLLRQYQHLSKSKSTILPPRATRLVLDIPQHMVGNQVC